MEAPSLLRVKLNERRAALVEDLKRIDAAIRLLENDAEAVKIYAVVSAALGTN